MDRKLKLVTIVGTRPEIIKMSEIIRKCDIYFEHILIHTGQNYDYELNEVFFKELDIRKPDYYLGVAGENLGQTLGNILEKSYKALKDIGPDAVIVLGDTNSCLSVISAKRLKIPVFHMEAGNRCFDENLPEEINRRIVDVTSDVNLCYSEHARRNLEASAIMREYIHVVGSPMAEVLDRMSEMIKNNDVLEKIGVTVGKYIILSAHREENIESENNFMELVNAVNAMAEIYGFPIIYSVHPHSKKIISKKNFQFHPLVKIMPPFGFSDYLNLQINAFCAISDSGTLPEEAAYFKFPAVSLRTSTERPEALEKGVFVIGSITKKRVLQAVNMIVSMKNVEKSSDVPDYMDRNVSMKVVRLIQSYTEIINQKVWRKKL